MIVVQSVITAPNARGLTRYDIFRARRNRRGAKVSMKHFKRAAEAFGGRRLSERLRGAGMVAVERSRFMMSCITILPCRYTDDIADVAGLDTRNEHVDSHCNGYRKRVPSCD
jgi:hypothetical protein